MITHSQWTPALSIKVKQAIRNGWFIREEKVLNVNHKVLYNALSQPVVYCLSSIDCWLEAEHINILPTIIEKEALEK